MCKLEGGLAELAGRLMPDSTSDDDNRGNMEMTGTKSGKVVTEAVGFDEFSDGLSEISIGPTHSRIESAASDVGQSGDRLASNDGEDFFGGDYGDDNNDDDDGLGDTPNVTSSSPPRHRRIFKADDDEKESLLSQRVYLEHERELWDTNTVISGDFWHDTDSSHIRRHGIRSRCKEACGRGTANEKCGRCTVMWSQLLWEKMETVVFLLALGGLTILLVYGMDRLSILLESILNELVLTTSESNKYLDFVAYMFLTGVMSMVVVLLVRFLAPHAAGSGIPALISFFSGVNTPNLLGLRTLFVKVTGLVLVYATSLYVGKEGPSVHIACCLAVLLMRLPFFARFRLNQAHTYNMLSAACATGVVAAFGCPFGGIVFAIEVCATYFQVANLPRMFVVSITGSILLYLTVYHDGSLTDPLDSLSLFRTTFSLTAPEPLEFALCIILGLICGILGGLFNNLVGLWIKLLRGFAGLGKRNPAPYGSAALNLSYAVLVTVMLCNVNDLWLGDYFPLLHAPAAFMENCLFSNNFQPLATLENSSIPYNATRISSNETLGASLASQYLVELQAGCGDLTVDLTAPLVYLTLTRFFLTSLSVALPIPAGLFAPTFLVGALVGRTFYILVEYLGNLAQAPALIANYTTAAAASMSASGILSSKYGGGEYAVIGAAALTSGVTRAISTAIIAVELTGQGALTLPMSLSVIVAYFTANRIAPTVYKMLLLVHEIPHMGDMSKKLKSVSRVPGSCEGSGFLCVCFGFC